MHILTKNEFLRRENLKVKSCGWRGLGNPGENLRHMNIELLQEIFFIQVDVGGVGGMEVHCIGLLSEC